LPLDNLTPGQFHHSSRDAQNALISTIAWWVGTLLKQVAADGRTGFNRFGNDNPGFEPGVVVEECIRICLPTGATHFWMMDFPASYSIPTYSVYP